MVFVLIVAGLILRLWHINFGLPHSWYADEPEIGEPAIKYTFELKNILRNNDVYKLAPENYVYGTFPVYFYTILLMIYSKIHHLLTLDFTKMDLYIYLRVINAVISLLMVPVFLAILKRLTFNIPLISLLTGVFLLAFNWKLIVHAHYLNHDNLIAVLILLTNLFFFKYLIRNQDHQQPSSDTKEVILFALCFGLAVSTKITVLLTFPLYLAFFVKQHTYKQAVAFIIIIAGVFVLTNPFAWIFNQDFVSRLVEMRTKEAGIVFDSVDYRPFKYLAALAWIHTIPVALLSLAGLLTLKHKRSKPQVQFLILMSLQILLYLLFFSLQGRRVDRWLLPIVPNMLLFAVIGLDHLTVKFSKAGVRYIWLTAISVAGIYYLYFPVVLTTQFNRNTPKSAAYIWAKENLPESATKYGLTEEGLDPLNKLSFATVQQFNAYESKAAQLVYPPDPLLYDYVIISSRPLSWTQNPYVVQKYPYYAFKWQEFSKDLANDQQFQLIKEFKINKPNLIPLSAVSIYQKVIQP
ncbi:MAG: hypothetical protein ABIH84_00690 [bacterium]